MFRDKIHSFDMYFCWTLDYEKYYNSLNSSDIRVSVVVPVYKVEEYLERCLDSLSVKDLDNIEFLLIDDGSPDRWGEMCEEYARK